MIVRLWITTKLYEFQLLNLIIALDVHRTVMQYANSIVSFFPYPVVCVLYPRRA